MDHNPIFNVIAGQIETSIKKGRRNTRLVLTLSDSEKQLIREGAKQVKCTMAAFARAAAVFGASAYLTAKEQDKKLRQEARAKKDQG